MTQFLKSNANKSIDERLLNFMIQIYESLKENCLIDIPDLNLTAIAKATNVRTIPPQEVLISGHDWNVRPTLEHAQKMHQLINEYNHPKPAAETLSEETKKRIASLEDEILELRDQLKEKENDNMVLRNVINSKGKGTLVVPADLKKKNEELTASTDKLKKQLEELAVVNDKLNKDLKSRTEQYNTLNEKYVDLLHEHETLKKSFETKSESVQKYINVFTNFAKDVNAIYEKYEPKHESK